jgi:ABC-2 type transport system ATP-binding protein
MPSSLVSPKLSGPFEGIRLTELTKRRGGRLVLDRVTLQARPGAVTGLVGANGAGKSSAVRLLLGLDRPTGGTALVCGRRYRDLERPLHAVGAVLDSPTAHPGRTARAHLACLAASHGIGRQRIAHLLEETGIAEHADRRVHTFSLGMRQRLAVAAALLGDPAVLVLDEPVNGLDPAGIRWIRVLMRAWAREGRAVLVSSHLMGEMARTADRVVVLRRGRVVADGTVPDVVRSTGTDSLEEAYRVLDEAAEQVHS